MKPSKGHSSTNTDTAIIIAPANFADGSIQSTEYNALAAQLQSAYDGALWVGVLDYANGAGILTHSNVFTITPTPLLYARLPNHDSMCTFYHYSG